MGDKSVTREHSYTISTDILPYSMSYMGSKVVIWELKFIVSMNI